MKKNIHQGSWAKSVVKHGKWYLLSSLFTKGLTIFLLPIYTRYLSPNEYGILQTLIAIGQFLPIILSLSLDSAFGRFFHDEKQDHESLQKLFSTIFWFVLVYGTFVLGLILATDSYWAPQLLSEAVYPYIYLAFIPALLNQLAGLGRVFLEQSLQAQKTTFLDIVSALLNAGISILLLVVFNLGVAGRLIGIVAASIFLVIFYLLHFIKKDYLKFTFSEQILYECLLYSVPLIPATAGSWISALSDRLVVAKYVGMEAAGLYSLGYQIAGIIYIAGDAVTRVLSPVTMSGLVSAKDATKNKMADFGLFLWGAMLVASLGTFLFAKEAVWLLADKSYFEAHQVIPIIAFTYVLGMQYRFPMTIISYHRKTWILTLGSILMGATNLAFNLVFVPRYGYMMATIAMLFSTICFTIWIMFWGQRLDKIIYQWKKYLQIFLIALTILCLSYIFILQQEISLFLFVVKGVIFCLAGAGIMYFTDKNIFTKGVRIFQE